MTNFNNLHRSGLNDVLSVGTLAATGNLTNDEILRLSRIREEWNFYEGYHWEGIDDLDANQVTFNYCKPFVNKFVAFELGNGFSIKTQQAIEDIGVTTDDTKVDTNADVNSDGSISIDEAEAIPSEVVAKTVSDFLNQVWESNNRDQLVFTLGQTKSVTGEAWVKVQYESPEDLDDPFEEYPDGKIRLSVVPTQYVFPEFNQHDTEQVESILIMYPIKRTVEKGILFKRTSVETIVYKELWTKDHITVYEDKTLVEEYDNPYGFIPFVQIKNFPLAGREHGVSDLDDIIPLNVELNAKKSDVSEIIDYHSAPITCVYGAKISNLEKGANKVWGGLPKDAKIENLSLQGDLIASNTYIEAIKTAMCEIGGIPETVLGGASAISNTSGVALQYMNLPLIEKTRVKRGCTKTGLQQVNKMILYIAIVEGLIEKPDYISMKDFLFNEVTIPDTLPKDELIELQKIEQEFKLALCCRHEAMERLNKTDIRSKLDEIDRERAEHPEIFNPMLQSIMYQNELNSGMTNGETPVEQVRKELTGQNGGAEV